MSITQGSSPSVPFGRHLGAAVRSGRDLLDSVLIAAATTYDTWIALNLISNGGEEGVPRADLRRNLMQAQVGASDAEVGQLLAQLQRHGLVRARNPVPREENDVRLVLTPEGSAEFQQLLAAVNAASGRALAGIDPEDVATTIRVLGLFREGAAAATP